MTSRWAPSFGYMDDVNILRSSSTGIRRTSSLAWVLGLAVWIGHDLDSRSLHQSPWIFNSSHLHSLSGGHLGSGFTRHQVYCAVRAWSGHCLPILLQQVQVLLEVNVSSKAWYFALFLPPPSICTEQIRHIRKVSAVFFEPDSGLSAPDYAGCNLILINLTSPVKNRNYRPDTTLATVGRPHRPLLFKQNGPQRN
jgi:hypothetical protein